MNIRVQNSISNYENWRILLKQSTSFPLFWSLNSENRMEEVLKLIKKKK